MVDYQLLCYKEKWIMKEVASSIDKVHWKLVDLDKLENEILNYVGKYLSQDSNNVNNKRFIKKLIHSQLTASLIRNKKQHYTHFSELSYEDGSGEVIEYEPTDVLANVESDLDIKETITLLAKDDRRRMMILNAWANGFTNDKALSETLASFFPGQARGHCSFIQRFRIECRGVLTATAI